MTSKNEYNTQIAIREDYTLHTTPLRESVINDICLNLNIQASSENCQTNAIVYAPDFFDEIKAYFRDLPNQEKTYATVQEKLGDYLVFCGKPDPDGSYRCKYDLRGDNRYLIFFSYDENNFYYEVTAPVGGGS